MSVSTLDASGTLYIVPTPIGNLSDITFRAVEVLKAVDVIAAEDTRHSARLMQHLAVATPMISLHEHNEAQRCEKFIERLKLGESIALISDAGTPLISDPGYILVNACRKANVAVVALPGPCAFITAASGAGMPTDNLCFRGFLPVKQKAKNDVLASLIGSAQTTVFYEAPRRIAATLHDIQAVLGESRQIAVIKEISKTFEHYEVGSAEQCISWLRVDAAHEKGEFVVIIGPDIQDNASIPQDAKNLLLSLIAELPLKKAAAIVAEHYSIKKNELYQLGLSFKK